MLAWDKVLVSHQGIHTISLNCFADTETPTRWEKLKVNDSRLPTSTETPEGWKQKVEDADSHLSHTNQSEECPQADHALFEPLLLTSSSKLDYTVLRALAHSGPVCLAKQ